VRKEPGGRKKWIDTSDLSHGWQHGRGGGRDAIAGDKNTGGTYGGDCGHGRAGGVGKTSEKAGRSKKKEGEAAL